MVINDQQLLTQQRDSVQSHPSKDTGGSWLLWNRRGTSSVLPGWGTLSRDAALRELSYSLHNTLFAGVLANLAKDIAATPWQLDGGARKKQYYQELLLSADFGGGWRNLILKCIRDYATMDRGAFVEIIGPGRPDTPLLGRVTGLAALDPLRCIPTNDPMYPVVYRNVVAREKEAYHILHFTRVYRLIDSPSSDERLRENGLASNGESALSRYFGYFWDEVLMGRYTHERLNDQPPAGWVTVSGVNDIQDVIQRFEAERNRDGQGFWRNLMRIEGHDPNNPPQIDFIPFANIPEGFNRKEAIELNARLVALSFGVDPQDVMPLTGQSMGTGAQSQILADKARGKTKGDLLRILERFLNTAVLPPEMEFNFQEPDEEKSKAAADRAQVWVDIVNGISDVDAEKRLRILANNVPEIADVIVNDDGSIDLPDDDVKSPQQQQEQPLEDTETEDNTASPGGPATAPVADTDNPDVERTERGVGRRKHNRVLKAYPDTEAQFKQRVAATLEAVKDGSMNRRRAGTVMRAHLSRSGRQSFLDGLRDGGVNTDSLDKTEQAAFAKWLTVNSAAVTTSLNKLYADGAASFDPEQRATAWANKSLRDAYYKALTIANKNGMMKFTGPDGKESCRTCRKLKGRVYRLSTWERARLVPGRDTDRYECGGWNCEHYLERTTEKSTGTRLRMMEHYHDHEKRPIAA